VSLAPNYSAPTALLSLCMPLLPRKGLLAIAAVVDLAAQRERRPISAKTLALRHGLPPRHLEAVLQALVRDGILKSVRGPRGGYALARAPGHVTANDILRAAGTVEDTDAPPTGSELVSKVVAPALFGAEREFGKALSRITLEDMARSAEKLAAPGGEPAR
jgi:Rrf2 family iron-sulfur cluster assembly transcriptional regulator